jgi:hypothetical protein
MNVLIAEKQSARITSSAATLAPRLMAFALGALDT